MRTDKEWMREDTWHFEVEVLRIYGRQELWSHGFGARPVSDGPYQPVDAADVRRRVAFGARQDNEFAVRHCCVHRSRWSVVSGARVPRGTSKPLATTSSASEREEAVRQRFVQQQRIVVCKAIQKTSNRPLKKVTRPAENRTRGPTMATLDFTTKPLDVYSTGEKYASTVTQSCPALSDTPTQQRILFYNPAAPRG
ncbi:hypothetical protein THAOC_26168 [Thalassiosira oceanica]|uniref:DUF6743 domain-containing protein n=1 Tax=Thalassiosira oceanica TaxID=159749 RepID=K0S5V3_THAOC|nr:hypothetical protein THAOC_26168 [Thalassiosira oceanica]|eukprot:EJK54232.1 hypothetical protein THAOC_26168 [Thalassiosira oceanica]